MHLDEIKAVVDELPWAELRAAYDALLAKGERPGAAASTVARLVDHLVDWETVVKGPAGIVIEALDFPLVKAAVALGLRFTARAA